MIFKAALLLVLLLVVVLGVFGKGRRPGLSRHKSDSQVQSARKCATCGSYLIGPGPCASPDCPGD